MLKLVSPVFDKSNSSFLTQLHVFFNDTIKLFAVISEFINPLILPTIVVDVAETSHAKLEGNEDPE